MGQNWTCSERVSYQYQFGNTPAGREILSLDSVAINNASGGVMSLCPAAGLNANGSLWKYGRTVALDATRFAQVQFQETPMARSLVGIMGLLSIVLGC